MSRVFVTAGAGTVGLALVDLLLEMGHEPVVLDARPLPARHRGVRQIVGRANNALLLEEAAEGCEHLFHLEWSGSVHRTTQEPVETNAHNTTAVLLALQTAKHLSIPLTFASTSVYRGDSPLPCKEEDPKSEKSLYVVQKLYAESCVRAFALMFGISTCSLRIFNVYGGENPKPFQIIPRLRESIANGTPIKLTGDGGQMRDFVHVSDVARAFASTMGRKLEGDAFNVGTGSGISMLDLTRMIMQVSGQSVPIEFVPALSEESRFIIADPTKSSEVLDWQAGVSLRDGLGIMFAGRY